MLSPSHPRPPRRPRAETAGGVAAHQEPSRAQTPSAPAPAAAPLRLASPLAPSTGAQPAEGSPTTRMRSPASERPGSWDAPLGTRPAQRLPASAARAGCPPPPPSPGVPTTPDARLLPLPRPSRHGEQIAATPQRVPRLPRLPACPSDAPPPELPRCLAAAPLLPRQNRDDALGGKSRPTARRGVLAFRATLPRSAPALPVPVRGRRLDPEPARRPRPAAPAAPSSYTVPSLNSLRRSRPPIWLDSANRRSRRARNRPALSGHA